MLQIPRLKDYWPYLVFLVFEFWKESLFSNITWNTPMPRECPIVHQGRKVWCSVQKTWLAWNLVHPIVFSAFFLGCKNALTMKIQEQSKDMESESKILRQQASDTALQDNGWPWITMLRSGKGGVGLIPGWSRRSVVILGTL